ETAPTVVDELIPGQLSLAAVHRVLSLLLEERVPISNLPRILESLAQYTPQTKDPVALSERIRADLGRTICGRFGAEQGKVHDLVMDPRVEVELRRALHEKSVALEPGRLEKLASWLANEWRKANVRGQEVALLTDAALRRTLRQVLIRSMPDLAIIAYQE